MKLRCFFFFAGENTFGRPNAIGSQCGDNGNNYYNIIVTLLSSCSYRCEFYITNGNNNFAVENRRDQTIRARLGATAAIRQLSRVCITGENFSIAGRIKKKKNLQLSKNSVYQCSHS